MILTKDQKYYQSHKKEKKEYDRKYRQTHKKEKLEYNRRYCKEHRKQVKEYRIKYTRKYRLTTGGKTYSVIKRNYPKDKKCELCQVKGKRLGYHHWGKIKKGKKLKGIWICRRCHFFISLIEKYSILKIYKKYLKLKEKIKL